MTNQQILGFKVTMQNSVRMTVGNTTKHLVNIALEKKITIQNDLLEHKTVFQTLSFLLKLNNSFEKTMEIHNKYMILYHNQTLG